MDDLIDLDIKEDGGAENGSSKQP